MKKRILSIVLAITMLFQAFGITGIAAETEQFVDFPDNWSTEAMTAAVENGLIMGTSPTTLEPEKYVTRAEFAAMLVRAFGAEVKADISNFTDVDKDAWYYDYVAKVCNMGVMNGTSTTAFSPNETTRREDVFLVLSRVLFISGDDETYLNVFEDKALIDSWSKEAIIGMVANEYLRGYEDNTLRPRNTITRAELAQILHNIFRTYISEPGEYTRVASEGSVVIRSADVVLKNVTINGDLILADGVGKGDVTLENVDIKGRLIVRGGEGTVDLIKVTADGNVIVNDVNGTVNFHNYKSEEPFANNVIENTPATYLEEPEEPSKPSGTGGGGGGGSSRKTLYFYADDKNTDSTSDAERLYKATSYRITDSDLPVRDASFIGWAPEKDSLENTFKDDSFFVGQTMKTVVGSANTEDFYAVYRYEVTFNKVDGTPTVVYANSFNIITGVPAFGEDQIGWSTSNTPDNTAIDLTKEVQDLAADGEYTLTLYPVYEPVVDVTGVVLDKTSITLDIGDTETLTATVLPADATNKEVTWTSSDENVATVVDGVVTAIGAGTATITVTTVDGNKTATCEVTVNEPEVPVTSVELDKTAITLDINDTETLTARVLPDNATNKNVTWTSSDENVATVVDGVVTAIGAGTATITVTTVDGNKTATCEVTVNEPEVPVTSVELDKTAITLDINDTETLTAKVLPENATNKNVTWASSDENVATVVDGVVTAIGAGTATITVTTVDGGKTATCEVTVNEPEVPVTSVVLDKTSIELRAGETDTLTATVLPENATNKNVTWASSDENVATVVDGVVTAIGAGTATITVTTVDGGKTATCEVTVNKQYKITFYDEDGEEIVVKYYNADEFLSDAPQMTPEEGFYFAGWRLNESYTYYSDYGLKHSTAQEIFGNVYEGKFTASFLPDVYEVKFYDDNDQVVHSGDYPAGTKITDAPTLTVEDFDFLGWARNNVTYSPVYTVDEIASVNVETFASNNSHYISFYPVLEPKTPTPTDITVKFYDENGDELTDFTQIRRPTQTLRMIPGADQFPSFTFEGWSYTQDSDEVDLTVNQLENATVGSLSDPDADRVVHLYPVLTSEGTYTVIFYDENGNPDTRDNLTADTVLTNVPELDVTGKDFYGWALTEGKETPDISNASLESLKLQRVFAILGVTGDTLELYPVLLDEGEEPQLYTVYFYNIDNTEVAKLEGYANDLIGTVADAVHPEDDAYSFLGWYTTDPEVLVESAYFADKTFADVVPESEMSIEYFAHFDNPYTGKYVVNHYFEKWNDEIDGFEFVADEELKEEFTEQLVGETVTAEPLFDEDIPEGFVYDEFNPDEVYEGEVLEDGSLELKFYYTAKVFTLRYFDLVMDDTNPMGEVYDVKFGTPTLDVTCNDGYELYREVGFGKDYNDKYVDNLGPKDGYDGSVDGMYTYNHKINYNWYVEDETNELGFTYCPTVPEDKYDGVDDGIIDIYAKVKNIRLTIAAPELVEGEVLTINIPYDEETRMIDSVRDALYFNDIGAFTDMVGIEDKLFEQLAGFGLMTDELGDYEIANVNDKMMYFYEMMGGKKEFSDWLWDFVEEDIIEILPEEQKAGFDVRTCNPDELPEEAQIKYYASEKFIDEATNTASFEVTADNEFIMERVEKKVKEYRTVDTILGGKIPEKVMTAELEEIIANLYEPRVEEFLIALENARADVAGTDDAIAVDSGIVFKVNLVEDLILPVYDYINTIYDKAMDKADKSTNRAAKLFAKLYLDNPYIQGDGGEIIPLKDYTDPRLILTQVEERDAGEASSGWTVNNISDILDNMLKPFTVQYADAMLWFTDEEASGVSFDEDIRPILEENSDLIIEVTNHLNALSEDYAKNGLPDTLSDYYEDLMSNDTVANAINSKAPYAMMTYVETAVNNNVANTVLRKMLSKFGVNIEGILNKYASSKASEPLTESSFAEYLDKVAEAFECSEDGRVNYKVTTDSVLDVFAEKIPEDAAAKGIEVTFEVRIADEPNYAD